MRITALLFALALAACGQGATTTTPSEPNLPDEEGPMWRAAIVAVGETWQLNGDPRDQAVSVYMDDGTEATGTWVRPYYVDGRISASDIRVTLEAAACELNSVPYRWRATVTFPGHTLTGCAAPRWDYDLETLIPHIDACIARAPDTRWVSYAGEQPDGNVLVRFSDDGGGSDCTVTAGDTPTVISYAARVETLPMATENDAQFVRAREGERENPGGECYQAPEVFGNHEVLLGWMMDPMGC